MRRDPYALGLVLVILASVLFAGPALAAGTYDPGASDTEIKIGNTNPYSGPASSYGTIGRSLTAYFNKVNEEGGINGRRINFISLDDGYSPPRTVEQVRRLVEQDGVLFLFQTLGTPTNTAIWKYVNDQKIPHLFVATGATKWGDPTGHPWTMGWQPTYQTEGKIYANYIRQQVREPKIGILYQNDDYGKDYVKGLKDGLGAEAGKLVVLEQTYEVTDPSIDSQIINLKTSGANVFFDVTIPKFAVQAIRKAHEIGWRPLHILNQVSASVDVVLRPAGLDASKDLVTALFMKDPTDPRWRGDPGYRDWLTFMQRYYPAGNTKDVFNVYGYSVAQTLVHVLKQCGSDLTRANLVRQAASIKDLTLPMLLPDIRVNTSPTDFYPIEQEQLARFDGERWVLFGELYDASRSR
jgi:branched-chain amino acid transport system substrate-binding protein